MVNDHMAQELSSQHRQDILHRAELDRTLRALHAGQADTPGLPALASMTTSEEEGIVHRVRMLFQRAARPETIAERNALCRAILEQFSLGAINIDEAERRIDELLQQPV